PAEFGGRLASAGEDEGEPVLLAEGFQAFGDLFAGQHRLLPRRGLALARGILPAGVGGVVGSPGRKIGEVRRAAVVPRSHCSGGNGLLDRSKLDRLRLRSGKNSRSRPPWRVVPSSASRTSSRPSATSRPSMASRSKSAPVRSSPSSAPTAPA